MAREGAETFNVNLTLPQPVRVGSIGDGQGVGRITNDDWGRRLTGSGRLLIGNGGLSLRVYEFWSYFLIRYYQGSSFNFRATSVSSRSWNDLTRSLRVTGSGWNAGHAVTYTLDATDNGGALDSIVLTLSDGSSVQGTLATGGFTYSG
jgi:hypothetical protein